jgi:hypothetical protein
MKPHIGSSLVTLLLSSMASALYAQSERAAEWNNPLRACQKEAVAPTEKPTMAVSLADYYQRIVNINNARRLTRVHADALVELSFSTCPDCGIVLPQTTTAGAIQAQQLCRDEGTGFRSGIMKIPETEAEHCSTDSTCSSNQVCTETAHCSSAQNCTTPANCSSSGVCTSGAVCSTAQNCTTGNNCSTGGTCTKAHGSPLCSTGQGCTTGPECPQSIWIPPIGSEDDGGEGGLVLLGLVVGALAIWMAQRQAGNA